MIPVVLYEVLYRMWPLLFVILLLASCFKVEPVKVDGAQLNCDYAGKLAFSGSLTIEGQGVIAPEDLAGTWRLHQKGTDLDCSVTF